jgi:acyl-coenzyme A synthetase/AMP-(fatty) acid ligase
LNESYDAEGNITAVDGGATAQCTYNELNQRVQSVANGLKKGEFIFHKVCNMIHIYTFRGNV